MQTLNYSPFSIKQKVYMHNAMRCKFNVAEGAIRSSKTIMHCLLAAIYLETCPDTIHLASGSTIANAKLNIGVCNGFGIENLFRGRCKWGKFKDNECLYIDTQTGRKILIFAGGGKRDSYKKILGNSYGLWIATEINEHYDSDNSRESFIKVALGRQVASAKPYVLWDLNPCSPNHKIYKEYIEKFKRGYKGGYNYQHFTLIDNLSISPQRLKEIESQYDVNSVWYRRDILGERATAEGLCFQQFANSPKKYLIESLKDVRISRVIVGVDFGGNGSKHAIVAVGLTERLQQVIVLKSERIEAKGMDAERLANVYCDFCEIIIKTYGKAITTYCDSAEQVLINQLRKTARIKGIRTEILNASKIEINERIRLLNLLIAQQRFKVLDNGCNSVISALSDAVWDEKKQNEGEDVRKDDGTTDIDTCDALEYCIEKFRNDLINVAIATR